MKSYSVARHLKDFIRDSSITPHLNRWRTIRNLKSWESRDSEALQFYSQFIGCEDICFDVGANRGNRTKVFRRLGKKVIAIEPQDSCMSILRSVYELDPIITLVRAACGSSPGKAILRISDADTLSSLSDEWIAAVIDSGRFADRKWRTEQPCELITLDALIESHGVPGFIKIDVEGYELNVIKGLSRPVRCLSFEFTPETLAYTRECIEYLTSLGMANFNLCIGESFHLISERWLDSVQLMTLLGGYRQGKLTYGDVYARQSVPATRV